MFRIKSAANRRAGHLFGALYGLVVVILSPALCSAQELLEPLHLPGNEGSNPLALSDLAGAEPEGNHANQANDSAEDDFFTLTNSAALYSAYIFRSFNLYDGLSLQPSLQGTFNLEEYGNVSLIHWMHLPAGGEQYQTRFVEMDEGIGYDYTLGDVTFSLIHYWYLYPNGNANTLPGSREAITTISWDTLLQPYLMFAYEYRAYRSQYYEVGLKHTFGTPEESFKNLTVFGNCGWATNGTPYWSGNGYRQATFGASTDIQIGSFTITPLLSYSNGVDLWTTDQWWGGVNISVSL